MYNQPIGSTQDINIKENSQRESEVANALGKLTTVVGNLEKTIDRLQGRLSPVLRQELKEAGDKVATPEYSVQIAQAVNTEVRKINNLTDWIENIIDRIEV